jgi:hypothetical protein
MGDVPEINWRELFKLQRCNGGSFSKLSNTTNQDIVLRGVAHRLQRCMNKPVYEFEDPRSRACVPVRGFLMEVISILRNTKRMSFDLMLNSLRGLSDNLHYLVEEESYWGNRLLFSFSEFEDPRRAFTLLRVTTNRDLSLST